MRLAPWCAVLLSAGSAYGHGMRTGYLEIVHTDGDGALVTWRTTVADRSVTPSIAGCVARDEPRGDASANARTTVLHCDGGLAGREVRVTGLGPLLTEAVVRIVEPGGRVRSHILTPAAPAWIVPATASWWTVARQYVRLGVMHIALGPDHLLFLLALVILVRRPRDVLVTETAFTLSHSLSFAATALGLVRLSPLAAEACIALSLVLVAADAIDPRARAVARTHGPLVALVFGLVHGLGFAGALGAVGLPDDAIAPALVAFGAGVEIGQIVFLAAVLGAITVVARTAWMPRLATAGSYLVGISGGYWLVERLWRMTT